MNKLEEQSHELPVQVIVYEPPKLILLLSDYEIDSGMHGLVEGSGFGPVSGEGS
jgi:hypothetical protein